MLLCAALVSLMIPAVGLLNSGLSGRESALRGMWLPVVTAAVVSVQVYDNTILLSDGLLKLLFSLTKVATFGILDIIFIYRAAFFLPGWLPKQLVPTGTFGASDIPYTSWRSEDSGTCVRPVPGNVCIVYVGSQVMRFYSDYVLTCAVQA